MAGEQRQGEKLKVFISHSRVDEAFADELRLRAKLEPYSQDWEICSAAASGAHMADFD